MKYYRKARDKGEIMKSRRNESRFSFLKNTEPSD